MRADTRKIQLLWAATLDFPPQQPCLLASYVRARQKLLTMFQRYSGPLHVLVGLALCSASAALAAALFASRPSRLVVPLVFVFVLLLIAIRYGAMVGILGSVIAAAIFAWFLYPPAHSLVVSDASERSHLAWMVLAGVTLSYLLAGPGPHTRDGKK